MQISRRKLSHAFKDAVQLDAESKQKRLETQVQRPIAMKDVLSVGVVEQTQTMKATDALDKKLTDMLSAR